MDSHKNTSPFIREESHEPITTTTTTTITKSNNNNDMVDIELADSKAETESAEKERAEIIKKLIMQLVVFVLLFCLLYFGGWILIKSCSATVDLFINDCEAKGGHFEGRNATGSHKSVCKGIDEARSG
jgi:hypothetical protein